MGLPRHESTVAFPAPSPTSAVPVPVPDTFACPYLSLSPSTSPSASRAPGGVSRIPWAMFQPSRPLVPKPKSKSSEKRLACYRCPMQNVCCSVGYAIFRGHFACATGCIVRNPSRLADLLSCPSAEDAFCLLIHMSQLGVSERTYLAQLFSDHELRRNGALFLHFARYYGKLRTSLKCEDKETCTLLSRMLGGMLCPVVPLSDECATAMVQHGLVALVRVLPFSRPPWLAHLAARNGETETLQFLLELGYSPLDKDARGYSVLSRAVQSRSVDTVELVCTVINKVLGETADICEKTADSTTLFDLIYASAVNVTEIAGHVQRLATNAKGIELLYSYGVVASRTAPVLSPKSPFGAIGSRKAVRTAMRNSIMAI